MNKMGNPAFDIKAYYYFLLDTDALPRSYTGDWEKDKEKFKRRVKNEKK